MIKKKFRILISGLLCLSMLSGCGKVTYDAPELLEPVLVNESYRPVEYGNIGSISLNLGEVKSVGTVVPQETSYFWPVGATVDTINVKEGDYVEAGTVLATADMEDANEVLSDISARLSLENQIFEQNEQIFNYKRDELNLKIDGAKALGNSSDGLEKELAILEENHTYDVKLHNFNVSQINLEMSKQRKLTSDATLVADKAGYVTYVKDLSETNKVTAADSIVVVADYDDLYIEMPITISKQDKNYYSACENFYTYIDGQRYELHEYEYSPEVVAVAENKGAFPNLRFKFEDDSLMPEIGQNVVVYLYRKVVQNVLIVGHDSVSTDEDGYYVYVLEDGVDVKRHIEVGASDVHYYEVVSGLEEGELVKFSSMTAMPTNYKPFTCSPTTYVMSTEMTNTKYVTTKDKVYYSEYEGIVQSIEKEDGKSVQKGDRICTIQINDGSARLSEMSTNISNCKEDHQRAVDAFDKQINELQDTIDAMDQETLSNNSDDLDGSNDIDDSDDVDLDGGPDNIPVDPNLRQELGLELNMLRCEKQIENINYNYQITAMQQQYSKLSANNNGSGLISIYAEQDGVVANHKLHEGKVLKYGDRMFDVRTEMPKELWINPFIEMHVNQKIKIYDKKTKEECEGTVLGGPGFSTKFYFDLLDDKMFITGTTTDKNRIQYRVVLDDESFYDRSLTDMNVTFELAHIENAIIIPRNAVYTERYEDEEYTFTWKIMDDGLMVKQYIELLTPPSLDDPYVCVLTGLKDGDVVAVNNGVGVEDEEEEMEGEG